MKKSVQTLEPAVAELDHLGQRYPELTIEYPVLIGVSGGRDSMCLLHFMHGLGWTKGIVCHLNHQLRAEESDADEVFVREAAARLGLKFESSRTDVADKAAKKKISIELAGREARDLFFQKMGRKHKTPFVFLAHHLDDQAETVIGNLFRGTGLSGLGGMTPSSECANGMIKLRPLLKCRRAELNHYLTSRNLTFREDSSNAGTDYRRNRLRHEVIPLLHEVFQREVAPIVDRLADQARRDHQCLDEMARDFARFHGIFQEDGSLRITDELRSAHPALVSRILMGLLVDVNGCAQITNRDIEAAVEMIQPGGKPKINLPEGKFLRRKSSRLWVEDPAANTPESTTDA